MTTPAQTDIAVIGMSGRFPGARNVPEYWRNLCNGVESVSFLSEDELVQAGVSADFLANPNYVRAAYLLEDADRFDAAFFGYVPREARFIDPQQRVLLECAWQALEHAGYSGGTTPQVGVYVGSSLNTYLLFTGLAEQFKTEPVLTLMSNDKDFLATRIGYKLQLEGPCVTVQTACSTSLVSVHMACQSLLSRECDIALAGGVCVKVPLKAGYMYREGGMLSRDGHCRAFDADATGTIFGSGAGIVVLKRYVDALQDGDTVHAVIKGTAINNDGGRKSSYTAPSVTGLADVIAQGMDFAEVKADDISYVECHGTGTALGDPIEVHAMTKAFRASTSQTQFCGLGSVKTNIGHLEAASGIAGLIKAILCLKNQYIPASLHFQKPNPALNLCCSPFYVNSEGREWAGTAVPRTAAVNSLGVGGTNASVIVQEAIPQDTSRSGRRWHLLPVSAKTAANTKTVRETLVSHFKEHADVSPADAAYTLQLGRHHFDYRDVVFVDQAQRNVAELATTVAASKAQARPVIFLFGSEVDDRVASALAAEEPAFDAVLQETRGELTRQDRYGSLANAEQTDAFKTFLFQSSLAALWSGWGVTPNVLIGDGIGALAAAHAAKAVPVVSVLRSLEDGLYREQAGIAPSIYFTANLEAAPVTSADCLEGACRNLLDLYPNGIFVPVGSASALSATMMRLIDKSTTPVMISPLDRTELSETRPPEVLEQAAALWKAGAAFDGAALYKEETRYRIPLPTSPLAGARHWWA